MKAPFGDWFWCSNRSIGKLAAAVCLSSWILLSQPGMALAAYVTQGLIANETIPAGAIVSLAESSSTNVVLASLSKPQPPIGAASLTSQGVVAVNTVGANIQVVTTGETKMLVSDINGEIHRGDALTLSPIDGVSMRVSNSAPVVGIAQADGSTAENRIIRKVTDKEGQEKSVTIGLLASTVQVGDYQASNNQGSTVLTGIQALSSNLAGKELSPVRAAAAFAVVVLATLAAMVVLFSAVTSSIRSIGRNPLAKRAVFRSLGQVIFAVIIIIFAAFAGVYVIVGI